MYTLSFREDETTYDDRSDAIEAAKEATDSTHHEARIEDERGVESLVYHRGEMVYYEFDTRRLSQLRRQSSN